jgi:hypothetical protein
MPRFWPTSILTSGAFRVVRLVPAWLNCGAQIIAFFLASEVEVLRELGPFLASLQGCLTLKCVLAKRLDGA